MKEDSFKKRRRALEEDYFEKANTAAMQRLDPKAESAQLNSPVSGKPMQETNFQGTKLYYCPQGSGIWLGSDAVAALQQKLSKGDTESIEQISKLLAGLVSKND